MSEIKNVGETWMAKCNQLKPLPFKELSAMVGCSTPVIYSLTEIETETENITYSLTETEIKTKIIIYKTKTKYKRQLTMPKRNRNRNENYFKTKIVAYWPLVSAKLQYSETRTVLLEESCAAVN